MRRLLSRLFRSPAARTNNAAPAARHIPPRLEVLEPRDLLAAGITFSSTFGSIVITGSSSGDTAKVTINDQGTASKWDDKVVVKLTHEARRRRSLTTCTG